MRAVVLALALITAPIATGSLTACSTASGQMDSRQYLFAAALAYEGALDTVKAAADSGALKGENATKAKTVLDQAHTALLAAKASQSATGARQVLAILASLEGLTNAR